MGELTKHLLDRSYLSERAKLIDPDSARTPAAGLPSQGGTVYLTAADSNGMMVSFIQSNYQRSEEHTSELQSLMRISYAVFCLKKKHINTRKEKKNRKTKYTNELEYK